MTNRATSTGICILFAATTACGNPQGSPGSKNAPIQGQVVQQLTRAAAAAAWSGTITIKQTANRSEAKDDHVCCKSTSANSLVHTVTITVTQARPPR